ncbi:MAG: hypothetical protein BWX99_01394 [Deltaproteobacteria bacterium ADurb.Bin151]|nr:MAG: hypothetical protein BWX99_01394 [Deltaproteobacteria bacterium ADurb.Bin151]
MRPVHKLIAINICIAAEFFHPGIGFFDHRVFVTDGQGTGRAGLHARRHMAFFNAAVTQIAFINFVRLCIVLGNMERTGRHAFLAADALVVMDTHGFHRGIIQRPAGTDFHTGCVRAVHASVFPENPLEVSVFIFIFLKADKRPGIPLQIRRILIRAQLFCFQAGEFIPLLAGHLAAAACGAQGGIDQFYQFRLILHGLLPPTTFPR